MRIKVGSTPACAILLIAAASLGSNAAFAQAQDSCIKAPNGPAPPGSHWYYHTDHTTQSKCWSIKPAAQATQAAAVQQRPATAQQQRAQERPTQEQPTQEQQVQEEPVQEQSTPAGVAPLLAVPDSSPWPLPGQQPDAATTVWPAAPSMPTSTDTSTTQSVSPGLPDQSAPPSPAQQTSPAPQAPAAGSAQPNTPSPPTATTPAEDKPAVRSAAKPVAGPVKPVTSMQSRIPLAVLLAGLIGLLAIGMLLRRIVTVTLGRPHRIRIAQREPRLRGMAKLTPMLRHSPRLVPDQAVTEHRISEVEEALRDLAQRQRRRRAMSLGSTPNMPSTGARTRS